MADNKSEDIGKYARHPIRTMGSAFIAGAAIGAVASKARREQNKNPVQKFLDQLGH